jgi:hypothetical protein
VTVAHDAACFIRIIKMSYGYNYDRLKSSVVLQLSAELHSKGLTVAVNRTIGAGVQSPLSPEPSFSISRRTITVLGTVLLRILCR